MTLIDTKKHDTSSAHTVQQHHVQAAEHLELAAKSHKEVAKLISSGDHKDVASHVEMAKTHTAHAADHVVEANKKSLATSTVNK